MIINPKIRRRITSAIIFSLLLHVAFLVWSYFIRILPATPFPERTEAVFHVKIDAQEHLGQEKLKYDTDFSPKSPKPDNPFTETMASKSVAESEETIKDNIESSVQHNKQALAPAAVQPNQVMKKSELNDIVATKKVRHAIRENLVDVGEVPTENFTSGSPVLISGEDISKYFLDKSVVPSDKSLSAPTQAANSQNQFQKMKRNAYGVQRESKAMDLGTALTYQLLKYKDPQGDKYFKLAVKVRDATIDFPVIPKEIIFLLDASRSIGMERLVPVEQGLIYSLKHLNPDDHFNILAFQDKTVPFSPQSVKADPDNIKKAIAFLNNLQSWSTTDIYNALRSSIDLSNPIVPSYRVLISDGLPTTGILDARHVINEISKENDNKVSIFTFGGGAQVDPYMLDFIAFKNRGWSRVTDRNYFISREISKLYNEIKDPLLLNVRYYVSGLNESEIFPQTMPDFFKGSSFVVYGKYTDEDKFVMQIRGDTANDKKEFLVSASLKNAPLGDKQIAHDWAFHQVYYLIGLLKYNEDNQAVLDQIKDICTKYRIVTPYSIGYHKAPAPHARPNPAPAIAAKKPAVVVKK